MKFLTFILAISFALCIVDKGKHEKMVNFINKLRTTWTAKLYERDIVPLVGSWPKKDIELSRKTQFQTSNADLPKILTQEKLILNVRLSGKSEINLAVVHAGPLLPQKL